MLKNRVTEVVKKRIERDDLTEEFSKLLQKSINEDNTKLLDDFFGPEASKNYLTDLEISKLNQARKENRISREDGLYQYLNTMYLRLGFYYGCQKGNLATIQYFMEKQHLPGDLEVSISDFQKFLEQKNEIKGPPLKLAAASGNVKAVKYIYENSEAMVETSIGQPIEPTPLMQACETDNEAMVTYLLEKGGNPNASLYSSFRPRTPLTIAIEAKNANIIRLLVNDGGIVSNEEVNQALRYNLDQATIEFLLLNCVNKENPYQPYLLSAVESGNVALFEAMENNALVKNLERIKDFSEKSIEKKLLKAAASSGSVEMMRYLAEERNVDVKPFLETEYVYFENKLKNESHRSLKSTDTIIYHAACNNDNKNVIPLLQYLFSKVPPSLQVIQGLCSKGLDEIQTVAYLHSLIAFFPEEKAALEKIAFELNQLSLVDLFKIYNTEFIYKGNTYAENTGRNFLKEIEQCIQTKATGLKAYEILDLIQKDKAAATGALFYYCTEKFDRQSEIFCYILTQLTAYSNMFPDVDVVNCEGDTLAKFAVHRSSYHILRELLARGANPDKPNPKGETLLNPIVDFSYLTEREFPWIKSFIDEEDIAYAIRNSLLYETQRSLGGHKGIQTLLELSHGMIGSLSISQLINNCQQGHNSNWKVKALLSHLSEKYVGEMVHLVKHNRFKLAKSEQDYYFSRIENFDSAILEEKKGSNYQPSSPALFKAQGQTEVRETTPTQVNNFTP